MRKKIEISKQDILDASISVIKKYGADNLSVREVAKELNISTQVIYLRYENFQDVKHDLLLYAKSLFENIAKETIINGYYMEYGISFFKFVFSEPELFKYFYLSNENKPVNDREYHKEIVKIIMSNLSISLDDSIKLHTMMFDYCYSLAVQIVIGFQKYTIDDIKEKLRNFMTMLIMYFKNTIDSVQIEKYAKRVGW